MLTSCFLPSCVACYPSLPCTAVGPVNGSGRPTSSLDVCLWLGTFKATRQTCRLPFLSLYLPRGDLLLCQISNYLFQGQIVRCRRICKHNSAASLSCQEARGCTAGNDRKIEWDKFFSPERRRTHLLCLNILTNESECNVVIGLK